MPQNPQTQFDQTVLEMIEHSPVGAVPHTPAYQDALQHLQASHQVYPSADYKGGYVTVRSLVALPSFHAENLEAFLTGAVPAEALEPDAGIFSRYVASLPAAAGELAEAFRPMLVARKLHHRAKHGASVQDPVHTLFLVPGCGPHPGLPGNYLHGSLAQATADALHGAWTIQVHDSDDGAAVCEVPSQADAWAKFQDVLASAPFLLSELEALGFRSV